MSDHSEHLKALFANASKLPTTTTFDNFGFLIDGDSTDPVENINNLEPFKPVTLVGYHPSGREDYHGQKLGVIMARTPEAVKSLQNALLQTNTNGEPALSNAKRLRILHDSQLAFVDEMPLDVHLDHKAQLIADRNCKVNRITADNSKISLAPGSNLLDSTCFNTQTGTLDSAGNFIPGPVNMKDVESFFSNSQIAQAKSEQLQTEGANLYNTLALDANIIDSTVGFDDFSAKMPKIINRLVSVNLNDSKIDSQYGSKLTKAEIINSSFQAGRLPVTVTNAKVDNSYLSDAGTNELHTSGKIAITDSEISNVVTNHAFEVDSSTVKGSKEKPIVATKGLIINKQNLDYPEGAIFATPAKYLEAGEVDSGARIDGKQKTPGKTDSIFCFSVNPDNKPYQELTDLNNTKDNAAFEGYDDTDPITYIGVPKEEFTKNRLVNPNYYATNNMLFSETRASLLAAIKTKAKTKIQDGPEL